MLPFLRGIRFFPGYVALFMLLVLPATGLAYSQEELYKMYKKYKNNKSALGKMKEELRKRQENGEDISLADLEDEKKLAELKAKAGKDHERNSAEEAEEDQEEGDENEESDPKEGGDAKKAEKKPLSPEPPEGSGSGPGMIKAEPDPALAEALEQSAREERQALNQRFCSEHVKQARAHLKAGDLKKAREEAMSVLQRDPAHAEARFLSAVILAKGKAYSEAWKHIEIARQADPDNPKIREFIERLEKACPRPSPLPVASEAAHP